MSQGWDRIESTGPQTPIESESRTSLITIDDKFLFLFIRCKWRILGIFLDNIFISSWADVQVFFGCQELCAEFSYTEGSQAELSLEGH